MREQELPVAMENFRNKCREFGLKITPQRAAIYKELLQASDHPTIDSILKKVRVVLPSISFDTVYRTVISFSEAGIIHMVGGFGGSRRFDADTSRHHHFKCIKCGKIFDFLSDYYDNVKIPEELSRNFKVLSKRVLLEGICRECCKK
jgi:Fur family peroxide stress response transcriptional regulator